LRGDEKDNILDGGYGQDFIHGMGGDDTLIGSRGDDKLVGGTGTDSFDGGGGFDLADFFHVADEGVVVDLGAGTARVGTDPIESLVRIEAVRGGAGDDRLIGDDGRNALDGYVGDDVLVGGRGNDTLTGGNGDDRFVFTSNADGKDTITDFGLGNDRVDLSALLAATGGGAGDVSIVRDGRGSVVTVATAPDFELTLDYAQPRALDLDALDRGVIRSVNEPVALLDGVPSYEWVYSCEPIAFASTLAYWDHNGYPNLFDANGFDEVSVTENIWMELVTPEHFDKYTPMPDDPTVPEPPDTSLADFVQTAEGNNKYPFSAAFDPLHDAPRLYAAHRGYDNFDAVRLPRLENPGGAAREELWALMTTEIDAGRPFVIEYYNHSRPVFGYAENAGGGRWYATYDHTSGESLVYGESEDVRWMPFQTGAMLNAMFFGPDGSLDYML
jgi:hypothetical protein